MQVSLIEVLSLCLCIILQILMEAMFHVAHVELIHSTMQSGVLVDYYTSFLFKVILLC